MSKIAILSGTIRPASNTSKVVAHLDAIYRSLGQTTTVIDLAALPPEVFLPTVYAEKPAAFAPFSDAILNCSGLHVVTPEYNGSFPGVLKHFIDLLKFPESFEGRVVCFTGVAAGMWGALRSVEQLQAIFAYRNAHLFPERVFLPGIGKHISEEGRLTNEDYLQRLREQAEGFVKLVDLLAPAA